MGLASDPGYLTKKVADGEVVDAVVIGSGYGASICAARLAQAGQRVVVLERGREFARFPDNPSDIGDNVQIDGGPFASSHRLGLFDFHISRDLDVLVGCGLGGTSLINANVSIRPSPEVFDQDVWPSAIRAAGALETYFDRALAVLDPRPFPGNQQTPRKLLAMEENGATRCTINVHFDKAQPTNSVGVPQDACTHCGDCITGCNNRAKKTLCFTYLPLATAFGAQIFVQCDVRHLEREADGTWVVCLQRLVAGDEPVAVTHRLRARRVIVGAGVLGTTGILLRSKLPIAGLGSRVSGNGDAIALAYDCKDRLDSVGYGQRVDLANPVGATILGVIDRRQVQPVDKGVIIEEGAFPSGLANLLRALVQVLPGQDTGHGFLHWFDERIAEGRDLFGDGRDGALNRTLLFLLMGHDGADGRIVLDDLGRATIRWPELHTRDVFTAENALARAITERLDGTYVKDPLDTAVFCNNLITVHPLGGCPMGSATDDRGRVLDDTATPFPGLYVADASIIPTSLGVNPLLTICALAERAVAHLIRDDLNIADFQPATKLPR